MASKIIKHIIGLSWIGTVIYVYFMHHSYYQIGWTEIGGWLLYILLVPLVYACYALYKWFNHNEKELKFTLTFPKIVAGFLLFLLITANAVFLVRDPSLYHGEDLFYSVNENGQGQLYEVTDISTVEPNEQLITMSGSAYEKTTKAFEWMPVNFQDKFEFPKFLNIQIGVLTKAIGILLSLALITITSISFGFAIMKKVFGKKTELDIDKAIISFGLGLFGIISGLFVIGVFDFFNIYSTWGLFALLIIISAQSFIEIIKKIVKFKYEVKTKILNFNLLILLVIGIVFSLNLIDNISPVPRGWDGLNQYVNIAKRIAEEGGLIIMGGNYNWELLMSLGYTMFHWTTMTLNLASFFPATICLFVLYFVLRKFMSVKAALFSTAALYLTPLFLFHGVEDNKVDLGNLAIGTITFLSVYLGTQTESKKERFAYIAIGGILAGFCFGIKITSLLLIFGLITMLLYKAYKYKGALGGVLFSVGLMFFADMINMGSDLVLTNFEARTIGSLLVTAGGLMVIFSALRFRNWKTLKMILIFIIFSGVALSPWLIKNTIESGSISLSNTLFGLHPQPVIDYQLLEDEYDLDRSLCHSTGIYEELDRYLGYDAFLIKFATLPWHTTMNDQGTVGIYVDIGWAFLAFIPTLLLFITRKHHNEKNRLILWFGISYWVLWIITSNGIIWYGLPGFVVLTAWIGILMDNYEKENKPYGKYILNIIIVIFLISTLVMRLGMAGKGTLMLYASNTMTAAEAEASIFPNYVLAEEIFRSDQDGQNDLIWKVGTPMNYFIPDNLWRTFNDQYLDTLNCLYQERDPEVLTERLRALGFGYIIFDYYTYSLSPDPESTLRVKYDYALDYVLNYTDVLIPDYYRGHIVAKLLETSESDTSELDTSEDEES